MGLLGMQGQNQWEADSMDVEPFIGENPRHINRTYLYTSFGERQIRYVKGGTCLKCLSSLEKSFTSLG